MNANREDERVAVSMDRADEKQKNYGLEGPQAVVNVALAGTVFIVDFFATVTKKLLYHNREGEYTEEIPTLAAIARASVAKQAGMKALDLARAEAQAGTLIKNAESEINMDTGALLERARVETDAIMYQLDTAKLQSARREKLAEKLAAAKDKADTARIKLREAEKLRKRAESMRDGDTDLKSSIAAAEIQLQDLELRLESYRQHRDNQSVKESKTELELVTKEMDAAADEKAAELELARNDTDGNKGAIDGAKVATEAATKKLKAEIEQAQTLKERKEATKKRRKKAVQDVLDGAE